MMYSHIYIIASLISSLSQMTSSHSHIPSLISSLFQMIDSHFSYSMPHIKYIPVDVFPFLIWHYSSQVYPIRRINILHITWPITRVFLLMDTHFHMQSLILSIFHLMDSNFILQASSQFYSR